MRENSLYILLERFSNLLRAEERMNGMEFGLQPVHLHILNYLSICNDYSDTPAGVTDYLGLTKGTVSQTITVLEKNNLVIKKPDNKDKRLQHLKLSTSALNILKKIIPPEIFKNAMNDISSNEQKQFENTLRKLLSAMQSNDRSRSFGVCNSCNYFTIENKQNYCGLTKLTLDKIQINKICKEHT